MPEGVTALFSAPSVAAGETQSILTITATSAATAGTATITIVGNGLNVANQNLAIQLTVTVPAGTGPFALALSVSSFLALPPTNIPASPVLTITRSAGFTGAVALTVSGQPAGLVVGVTPTNVTGNTATVLIIDGGAAKATYPITIKGVGGGGEQTLTFNVVVAAPSTGSTTWQFCDNAVHLPQYFFAVKDGAGAWTRIMPNGNSYSFTVTSPQAQVALVTSDSGGYRTTIYQYTAQEMAARAAAECVNYPGTSSRTVTGQISGMTAAEQALTSMATWRQSTGGPSGSYTLLNLPTGAIDLISVRGAANAFGDFTTSKVVVRRGLNPGPGVQNAPIDFNAAEAVTPTTAAWTFTNTNNEGFSITEQFSTAGGTAAELTLVPGIDHTTTSRTLVGIPTAQTVAGDLHQVIATIQTNGQIIRATRQVIAYARTLADRTVAFGPSMPAASVSAVTGAPAGRLRAQGTLPNEYNTGVSFDVTQTTTARFATIHATRGFLGAGTSYDIQLPDLTAAVGWDTNFALRTGVATNYWVSGGGPALDAFDTRYIFGATQVRWTGALTGITAPSDGATYLVGRAAGNITP